jgi:hypothetical protein
VVGEIGVDAAGVAVEVPRVSADRSGTSSSATRYQPEARRSWSVSIWDVPNFSDSRPVVTWRRTSLS